MIDKILKNSPPLTHLDFENLFYFDNKHEQVEQLMRTLSSMIQPTLLYLNMNTGWNVSEGKRFELLLNVL